MDLFVPSLSGEAGSAGTEYFRFLIFIGEINIKIEYNGRYEVREKTDKRYVSCFMVSQEI